MKQLKSIITKKQSTCYKSHFVPNQPFFTLQNIIDLKQPELSILIKAFEKVVDVYYKKNQVPSVSSYDAIIYPTTVMDLENQRPGWKFYSKSLESFHEENNLKFGETYQNQTIFDYLKQTQTTTCALLGNFNRGKSWFINKITDNKINENDIGYTARTRGVSIKIDKTTTYLDTAGYDMPTPMSQLMREFEKALQTEKSYQSLKDAQKRDVYRQLNKQYQMDKQFTEKLIQSFIIKYSQTILLLVDQLTSQDQKLINFVCKQLSGNKDIYIIHNYKNITTVSQLKQAINESIKQTFQVREQPLTAAQTSIWFGKEEVKLESFQDLQFTVQNQNAVQHLILGNDKSEDIQKYNNMAISHLKNKINGNLNKFEFDIISYFKQHTDEFLGKFVDLSGPGAKQKKTPTILTEESTTIKENILHPVKSIRLDKDVDIKSLQQNWVDEEGFLQIINQGSKEIKSKLFYCSSKNGQSSSFIELWIEAPGHDENSFKIKQSKLQDGGLYVEIEIIVDIFEKKQPHVTSNQCEQISEVLGQEEEGKSITILSNKIYRSSYQFTDKNIKQRKFENGFFKVSYSAVKTVSTEEAEVFS